MSKLHWVSKAGTPQPSCSLFMSPFGRQAKDKQFKWKSEVIRQYTGLCLLTVMQLSCGLKDTRNGFIVGRQLYRNTKCNHEERISTNSFVSFQCSHATPGSQWRLRQLTTVSCSANINVFLFTKFAFHLSALTMATKAAILNILPYAYIHSQLLPWLRLKLAQL